MWLDSWNKSRVTKPGRDSVPCVALILLHPKLCQKYSLLIANTHKRIYFPGNTPHSNLIWLWFAMLHGAFHIISQAKSPKAKCFHLYTQWSVEKNYNTGAGRTDHVAIKTCLKESKDLVKESWNYICLWFFSLHTIAPVQKSQISGFFFWYLLDTTGTLR